MWYLVGDIGGTNLRLAAVDPAGAVVERRTHPTDGLTTLPDACATFCAEMGRPPEGVAMAVAGVVVDEQVRMTNAARSISRDDLARACGLDPTKVLLLNDFEAAAWSLATLDTEKVTYLQGGPEPQPGARVIIGPGTGLGVGSLVWQGARPTAVPGEGGHLRLTPHSAEEVAYFEALIALWPEVQMGAALAVEAEAILSGTGMPYWYRAIASARGEAAHLEGAAAIFAAAKAGEDASACRAVALMVQYLGGVAGDLGLVMGARGGVFITGGVAQQNTWMLDDSFLAAFNAGGRHSKWRAAMPLGLCSDPDFGLLGARNCLFVQHEHPLPD
ncbi:ROK family protein [Sulfitobacter sp. 1A13368]|uniref:glucokinase n=1 Tax=Sulfitobacter sp. 1A13368 TaxID=3368593 RepID=UPI0037469E1E